MKKCLLWLLCAGLLLSGCNAPGEEGSVTNVSQTVQQSPALDPESFFSERDKEQGYDASAAVEITLSGQEARCGDSGVKIDGGTVTVTDEGVYVLSGQLEGMLLVDAEKTDKVQLVLNGVDIQSETGAALYVRQADKVFVTLQGENSLQNGGSFVAIDENNVDGTVFSKEDLTLNGAGSLTVISPVGHGVVSKDELTITGGSYSIQCAGHGFAGKDSVAVADGIFAVEAGKDGIRSQNDEDTSLGNVYIGSGNYSITAEGDGISASGALQIDDGSFRIVTGGGAVNGEKKTSDGWGGFGGGRGGMGGPGGGKGSPPGQGGFEPGAGMQEDTQEDSASIKGIKAGADLQIQGGSFLLDCADDGIHGNKSVTIAGGQYEIATGDDGFHADEALLITGGEIRITQSYEGLEGLSVTVSGGDIRLKATDDGINAAGGTDQSGFGGMRGGDKFGGRGGGSSDSFIKITGGTIYLNASGDGIDSNGTLEIAGGHTTVCGPTQGDTAVLDYEISGSITGGTFIGTGSYMMAQTFSSSEQGVIALNVNNQSAGTGITLSDSEGKLLVEHSPELSYAILIISTPEMTKGATYKVTVGEQSGEFEAQ